MKLNLFSIKINVNIGSRESVDSSEPEQQRDTAVDALVDRADGDAVQELSSRDGRHDIIWESKQRIGFARNISS
ncbi:hypothetical protein SEA_GREKAYCON_51 [Arthrobacter phage Grekaycon]|uniref:Uncharacterized protein n=2 Tax=Marthavirus martha TaxID=1980950 RepID=A0A514A5K6_9CAUD|nr:hypothetical protein FDH49_gp51 [Arthrobacter phage Martha]ALY09704.1 hypothetical protein MARTHA_51 [Arthrobacter phage Martha]QDH48541.1 hypothetical protein SEA_GREKAYCON_51 [Arthrobacter phage Grekaycon]